MHDFTLPANIKQIGSIGSGLRIYMEDYVCTFLHQYATSGGYDERIAYLVGRHMLIDGQSFLFISGAMYGMYAERADGYTRFSKQSAEYAESMLEEHFPGLEIVGWMQSQPSYGTYLNQHYGAYHLRQFTKPYHVLFVMDPLERVNTFYATNPNAITPSDRMAEIGGYFIYYEKNVNMHEYMLTNKTIDYKPPSFVELTPVEPAIEKIPEDNYNYEPDNFDEFSKHPPFAIHETNNTEDIVTRHKANVAKRRSVKTEQKRATSLLAGLCAVLFVITFVMGVGLVRNQDSIARMEIQIQQLVTAHRNLFAQIHTPEPVFAEAPQQPPVVTETPDESVYAASYSPTVYTQAPVEAELPQPTQPPPPQPPPQQPPPIQAQYDVGTLIPVVPEAYTIQPGDSLLAISLYFFGDANMVDAILALNGLEDPDMIVAGRTIALPQR